MRSRKAGERELESVSLYLEKQLKLQVNGQKSAVDRPWTELFAFDPSVNASVERVVQLLFPCTGKEHL